MTPPPPPPPPTGKRGLDDSAELPAIPTPETDARLRIPEVLKNAPVGSPRPKPDQPSDMASMSRAWAMGFDIVGMTLGGVALGWGVDYFLKSTPIALLIGFGCGFISAMIRVVRAMNRE